MTQFALLSHVGTRNFGDDIQNLAAAAFLPRIDRRIDRESLDSRAHDRAPATLILNGWFMHVPRRWPPRAALRTLPISMHIADRSYESSDRPADRMLSWRGRSWFRRHGPIGARDRWTLDLLRKAGIDAYLSGCLTLTLAPRPVPSSGEIVACDLAPPVLAHLRSTAGAPVRMVSHASDPTLPLALREGAASALLDSYSGARCVVTSRLHCALPCLALGTPVLFVEPTTEQERYLPAVELAHSCSAAAFLANRSGFQINDPPANPGRHHVLASALAAQCRAFVAASVT